MNLRWKINATAPQKVVINKQFFKQNLINNELKRQINAKIKNLKDHKLSSLHDIWLSWKIQILKSNLKWALAVNDTFLDWEWH